MSQQSNDDQAIKAKIEHEIAGRGGLEQDAVLEVILLC